MDKRMKQYKVMLLSMTVRNANYTFKEWKSGMRKRHMPIKVESKKGRKFNHK